MADFCVAAGIAMITAILALLVEDALSIAGTARTPLRIGALVVMLGVLGGALWWRARLRRATGTIYYLRLLDEGMRDWHQKRVGGAVSRWPGRFHRYLAKPWMSQRSVTRWVDIPSSVNEHGVIDIVEPCEMLVRSLVTAVATDRDDTGFTIAPNLFWPSALAVGGELPIVEDLKLLEVTSDDEMEEFLLPVGYGDDEAARRHLAYKDDTCGSGDAGNFGLFLAFAPSAVTIDPSNVFPRYGVGEYRKIWRKASSSHSITLTGAQMRDIAESLPLAVVEAKKKAGDADLVVIACLPKTIALALGWGLAQQKQRFYARTHLLFYDNETSRLVPMRVHRAQPVTAPNSGE